MKASERLFAHADPERAARKYAAAAQRVPGGGSSVAGDQLAGSRRMVAQRQAIRQAFGGNARVSEADVDAPGQRLLPSAGKRVPNRTGLTDSVKAAMESLSGIDLSAVRVHTGSDKPARLNALAYTQGTDIHVAPGQERHLPHEAWHVVQQAQGRVRPTLQMKSGIAVNDDQALEREADSMAAKALREVPPARQPETGPEPALERLHQTQHRPLQRKVVVGVGDGAEAYESIGFVPPSWAFDEKQKNILGRWIADDQQRNFATVQALQAAVRAASALPEFEPPAQGPGAPAPQEFSMFEHYAHKAPHALDLATSGRRQRMLVTSTLTRTYLNARRAPVYEQIPAEQIQLLHPNDLSDSKTKKRFNIVRQALRSGNAGDRLAKELIATLLPSDEEIQVARVSGDRYVSMQGVGRIVAIKEAGRAEGRSLVIEIKCFDLSQTPFLPTQLQAISESYRGGEGAVSRTIGSFVTAGLVAGIALLIGKLVTSAKSQ
jgi:hypothetical protein